MSISKTVSVPVLDEVATKHDEVVEWNTGRKVEKVCHLKETHVDGWYEFLVRLK